MRLLENVASSRLDYRSITVCGVVVSANAEWYYVQPHNIEDASVCTVRARMCVCVCVSEKCTKRTNEEYDSKQVMCDVREHRNEISKNEPWILTMHMWNAMHSSWVDTIRSRCTCACTQTLGYMFRVRLCWCLSMFCSYYAAGAVRALNYLGRPEWSSKCI